MPHLHFSPFQFATSEQVADSPKQVKAERLLMKKTREESERKTRDMGSTIPCSTAHAASSLPNAFVSPNSPDSMRIAKSVFGTE